MSGLAWGRDPTRHADATRFSMAARFGGQEATVTLHTADGQLCASAWGPGRQAALACAPALAGLSDDPLSFRPAHPFLRELQSHHPGLRTPRSGQVVVELLKATLGQLVTTREAAAAWRALVRRLGTPAPGPEGLWLPPDPRRLARCTPWELVPLGIPRKQAETVIRVAAVAGHMEDCLTMSLGLAMKQMMKVRGVGPWTAGHAVAHGLGHPDAVILGDLHLPRHVGRALAGEPDADDRRMMELLEPFRGHRFRVVRLIHTSGVKPPRRGPLVEAPPSWTGSG